MGTLGGQGKSEKVHVNLDRFVRIEGRQSFELGAHNPPMESSFSKILGEKPASAADFAETSPAGPAPNIYLSITFDQESYWRTYNCDSPGHGFPLEWNADAVLNT